MGKTILFINEKGGIGKTSACFNVSWEMAKRGYKILMIDMDGQRANLTFFAGVAKPDDLLTMYDVLLGRVTMQEATMVLSDKLSIIPATFAMAGLPESTKITRMLTAVKSVVDDYDYIMIDVNPTPNRSHVLALSVSDYVIIPMLPDVSSLEANKGIAESINEVRSYGNPNLKVLGLLFNKNKANLNLTKEVSRIAEKMTQMLDTKVFETKIRDTKVLSENVAQHVGVTDYAPKSSGAGDVNALVDEILEEVKKRG